MYISCIHIARPVVGLLVWWRAVACMHRWSVASRVRGRCCAGSLCVGVVSFGVVVGWVDDLFLEQPVLGRPLGCRTGDSHIEEG